MGLSIWTAPGHESLRARHRRTGSNVKPGDDDLVLRGLPAVGRSADASTSLCTKSFFEPFALNPFSCSQQQPCAQRTRAGRVAERFPFVENPRDSPCLAILTIYSLRLQCLVMDGRIAYQRDYLGGVRTDVFPNEKGDVLADALGDKDILLLANHGCIVVGRTIAQAMEDLYYLERAAMNQIVAMSTGSPLRCVPPAVLADFQAAAQEPEGKAD